MSVRMLAIEPVECLRCGRLIEVFEYDNWDGIEVMHGHTGASYTNTELKVIGEGSIALAYVRIVQAAREECMSSGNWKPLAKRQ